MNRVWTAKEVSKLIGISPSTVKHWAEMDLIPQPGLQGLLKTRIWGKSKVLLILEFARDTAGYFVPERCFDEVRGEYEAQEKR